MSVDLRLLLSNPILPHDDLTKMTSRMSKNMNNCSDDDTILLKKSSNTKHYWIVKEEAVRTPKIVEWPDRARTNHLKLS